MTTTTYLRNLGDQFAEQVEKYDCKSHEFLYCDKSACAYYTAAYRFDTEGFEAGYQFALESYRMYENLLSGFVLEDTNESARAYYVLQAGRNAYGNIVMLTGNGIVTDGRAC